jgi:hypothetical protein
MSATDPMFPLTGTQTNEDRAARHDGCSKLLYCMVHAPAAYPGEMVFSYFDENDSKRRRAWAEAMIKESERP